MTLLASLGTIVVTLAELAVILVAMTAVRRVRPDDWAFLAAGAGMHVLATLSFPLVMNLAGRIATMGSITTVYGAVQVLMVILRALGWLLVAGGLWRMATPPGETQKKS